MVFRLGAEVLLEVVEEGIMRDGGGVFVRGGDGGFVVRESWLRVRVNEGDEVDGKMEGKV
jgi:hypothetical protein